jgi:hypothetical protein
MVENLQMAASHRPPLLPAPFANVTDSVWMRNESYLTDRDAGPITACRPIPDCPAYDEKMISEIDCQCLGAPYASAPRWASIALSNSRVAQ